METKFRKTMKTPWGKIDWHHKITDGVIVVATPSHGGIWLSEEQTAKLPVHYKSYTGSKHFHEEDEDAPLVLQYLGLLSLITEPITLNITEADIQLGLLTREDYCGTPFHGGPIVEAYKRQSGENHEKMICSNKTLSPRPGGFKLASLSQEAQAFMQKVDDRQKLNPATVQLNPYIVLEPKKFIHHFEDKTTKSQKCSGSQAQKILEGDRKALEEYLEFKHFCGLPKEKTTKITHQGEVIYQVGSLVIELAYGGNLRSRQFDSPKVKCHRLFRPKISKVKPSFFVEIPQVSNTLTPSQ